jgi:hypothetical protein
VECFSRRPRKSEECEVLDYDDIGLNNTVALSLSKGV